MRQILITIRLKRLMIRIRASNDDKVIVRIAPLNNYSSVTEANFSVIF